MAISATATLVVPLVTIYLGISTYAASVVTLPQRDAIVSTPADFGARFDEVRFPARGGDVEIAGWYLPQPETSRAVILVHGKDSSRSTEFQGRFSEFAAQLHKRGFAVMMIDLRGHGASGDARFSFGLAERRDILGAVDWLITQDFVLEVSVSLVYQWAQHPQSVRPLKSQRSARWWQIVVTPTLDL
jgi:Lysophospholipase